MNRYLATIDAIIKLYEKDKCRLPKPIIKTALAAFKEVKDPPSMADYFNEYRPKILGNLTKFLTTEKSALIANRDAFIAVSAFYVLADELARDVEANYDLSRLDRASRFRDYPNLKLPLGYQLNLLKAILEAIPANDKDRDLIINQIAVIEASLNPTTEPPVSSSQSVGPSTEQLGMIVAGVTSALQQPKFNEKIQGIMSGIQTSDVSQIFPKIFEMLQDPDFRGVLEKVAQPLANKP